MQTCKQLFPISLSYVRPGTRFDLTCSPFGQTKREERIICINVNFRRFFRHFFFRQTVTLKRCDHVFSILFNEDYVTFVWILAGVACLPLTQMWYLSCKWKQIKMYYSHYIKSPPSCLSFLSENIFYISRHNWRAQSMCPVRFSIRQSKPQISWTNVQWPPLICRLAYDTIWTVLILVWVQYTTTVHISESGTSLHKKFCRVLM